jgi:hypothetical protein
VADGGQHAVHGYREGVRVGVPVSKGDDAGFDDVPARQQVTELLRGAEAQVSGGALVEVTSPTLPIDQVSLRIVLACLRVT